MNIVKVLKRKDASSVVVAIVVGLLVQSAVVDWARRPSDWLSGVSSGGGGWKAGLWEPLVTLVVGLVVLELVIWVYGVLASAQGKK